MNRLAQESRTDMAIMYLVCLMLIIMSVGTLYEVGVLGEIKNNLNGGMITGAAVVEEPINESLNETILVNENG